MTVFRSISVLMVLALGVAAAAAPKAKDAWLDTFGESDSDLMSTGANAYFPLQPGYKLTFEGTEDGKALKLIVSVTNDTKKVAGVETRVVEEREWHGGELAEVSRNYMAHSKKTGSVYYFGEDVDMYKRGKVSGHEGSWLAGEKGARYGMLMPGKPAAGAAYYQEIAPKVAMDRFRIVSVSEALTTPAGKFTQVVKTEETTPLEKGNKEYKYYAPGVGLVQDGGAKLVKIDAAVSGR